MLQATPTTTGRRDGTSGGWRAVGATPRRPRLRRRGARGTSVTLAGAFGVARRAFTLTEILIVIGLIVLIIAIAVPAFNVMTGGRSVDAAMNQLSAMLGRVRMEAIGLQEPRGLLFYRDPASQRVAARIVQVGDATAAGTGMVALDLVSDRDPLLLPVGVGLQLVDDAAVNASGARSDDGYIGFNTSIGATTVNIPVGGVILFDQTGRLSSRPYGFVAWSEPKGTGTNRQATALSKFLYADPTRTTATGPQIVAPPASRTQFGFVLYDEEAFKNQPGAGDEDPQLSGGSYSSSNDEGREETWLDSNAVPVLVNRYNGTLVRGQ